MSTIKESVSENFVLSVTSTPKGIKPQCLSQDMQAWTQRNPPKFVTQAVQCHKISVLAWPPLVIPVPSMVTLASGNTALTIQKAVVVP